MTQQQKRDKLNARLRKALTDTFAEMKDQENRAVDQIIAWEEQSAEKSSPLSATDKQAKPDSAFQIAGDVEEFLLHRKALSKAYPDHSSLAIWPPRTSAYERETAHIFNEQYLPRVRIVRQSLVSHSIHDKMGDDLIEAGAQTEGDIRAIVNHLTVMESGDIFL